MFSEIRYVSILLPPLKITILTAAGSKLSLVPMSVRSRSGWKLTFIWEIKIKNKQTKEKNKQQSFQQSQCAWLRLYSERIEAKGYGQSRSRNYPSGPCVVTGCLMLLVSSHSLWTHISRKYPGNLGYQKYLATCYHIIIVDKSCYWLLGLFLCVCVVLSLWGFLKTASPIFYKDFRPNQRNN